MSDSRNRWAARLLAALMTLALGGCDACKPWPEKTAPLAAEAKHLVVVPNQLDVFVEDPARPIDVRVKAQVYDRNHNPMTGEQISFAVDPAGSLATHSVLGGHEAKISIKSNSPPADYSFSVVVTHPGSGLTYKVPVKVVYSRPLHGVEVPWASVNEHPMAGLASGSGSGMWVSNSVRAFVRRASFPTFDNGGVVPIGDEPSGSVLSPAHALWRRKGNWPNMDALGPLDPTWKPVTITLTPVFAADNTTGTTPDAIGQFVLDLQGGAELIESSLIGATVAIAPTKTASKQLVWKNNCNALAIELMNLLESERPHQDRLMVYMVRRSADADVVELPWECDPSDWTQFGAAHAIFLPVGVVEAQSIAHEIGHALSLGHVSWNSGFFHSNLMVEAEEGMGALRDRFSVGQAFRAGLHTWSWIVLAGQNKSDAIDCSGTNPLCPRLSDDILARSPP